MQSFNSDLERVRSQDNFAKDTFMHMAIIQLSPYQEMGPPSRRIPCDNTPMPHKKHVILALAVCIIIAGAAFSLVPPARVQALTDQERTTLILQLVQKVLELQQKIVALGGTPITLPPGLVALAQGSGGSAGAAAPSCTLSRTLALGARGEDVRCLQRFLIAQGFLKADAATGFDGLTPSGYFGKLTRVAVKQFQQQHNLDPVGHAGRLTRAIVNEVRSSQTPIANASDNIGNTTGSTLANTGGGGGGGSSSTTGGGGGGSSGGGGGGGSGTPASAGGGGGAPASTSSSPVIPSVAETRDAQKQNDLQTVSAALQKFYAAIGRMPANYKSTGACQGDTFYEKSMQELVDKGFLQSIPQSSAGKYCYFDYGPGNTIGALVVTSLEAAPDTTEGIAPSCRPSEAGKNWCSKSISKEYCICNTYKKSSSFTVGKLTAIPATTSGIALTWGNTPVIGRTTIVERWIDGGSPAQITVVANASQYVDTTVEANRIYYYRVSSGTSMSGTATAVVSDIDKPFICPDIPPVPANKLGVDRTETFTNPSGQTVSFTIRAPVPKSKKVDVPPCGNTAGCSDNDNIKKAIADIIKAEGGTIQLAAGEYHFYKPAYANISIGKAKDLVLAGAGLGSDGIPLTHLYFNNISTSTLAHGIHISSSERVLVRDVSIDWDVINAIPGTVRTISSSEQRFVVQDPSYYIPDPANPPAAFNATGYNLSTRTYTQASGAREGINGPFNPNFANDGGYYYLLKGNYFPDGATAIMYVKTGGAIRLADADDISLESVHVYGGGGPGLITGPKGRGLRLSNFKITRKPDSLLKTGEKPRFIALFGDSDGNESDGGILIENSEFGFIDDDTFYNRGFAKTPSAVNSTSEIVIMNPGTYAQNWRKSGDALMFTDPVTMAPISDIWPIAGTWTQERIQNASGTVDIKWTIPFAPAIPELASYQGLPPERMPVVSSPLHSGPEFVMRNTCAHDNHGRVFLQSHNGLIENNVFAHACLIKNPSLAK
ncbi:MAG: peptidoglycan-binding domain-containing protein [Patescibacteria group bacterium]